MSSYLPPYVKRREREDQGGDGHSDDPFLDQTKNQESRRSRMTRSKVHGALPKRYVILISSPITRLPRAGQLKVGKCG